MFDIKFKNLDDVSFEQEKITNLICNFLEMFNRGLACNTKRMKRLSREAYPDLIDKNIKGRVEFTIYTKFLTSGMMPPSKIVIIDTIKLDGTVKRHYKGLKDFMWSYNSMRSKLYDEADAVTGEPLIVLYNDIKNLDKPVKSTDYLIDGAFRKDIFYPYSVFDVDNARGAYLEFSECDDRAMFYEGKTVHTQMIKTVDNLLSIYDSTTCNEDLYPYAKELFTDIVRRVKLYEMTSEDSKSEFLEGIIIIIPNKIDMTMQQYQRISMSLTKYYPQLDVITL